jgi:hypothetical protein
MSRLEVHQIQVVTIPKLLGERALPGRSGNQYAAKLLRCRGRVEGQDSQMHNNICQVLLELYRHDLTTKQVVCFLGHLHLPCVCVLLDIDPYSLQASTGVPLFGCRACHQLVLVVICLSPFADFEFRREESIPNWTEP